MATTTAATATTAATTAATVVARVAYLLPTNSVASCDPLDVFDPW